MGKKINYKKSSHQVILLRNTQFRMMVSVDGPPRTSSTSPKDCVHVRFRPQFRDQSSQNERQ